MADGRGRGAGMFARGVAVADVYSATDWNTAQAVTLAADDTTTLRHRVTASGDADYPRRWWR